MAGREQPSQAQAGGEDLAGRAGVYDVVGGEALQRADRVAVVAVLGVVVVFDHDRVVADGPVEQRRPPAGWQHHAGRKLVGWRHDDGLHGQAVEFLHPQSVLVYRDGKGFQPGAKRYGAVEEPAGILDRDAPGASGMQGLADEPQALHGPGADEQLVRVG
jgi:hypothetical protein